MTESRGRTARALLALTLVGPALVLIAAVAAPPAGATFPGANGRIAFVAVGNVHTAAPDGSDVLQLTSMGQTSNPRWSPDGSRILFEVTSAGETEIWVMDADGTDQAPLTSTAAPADDRSPAWSPDGTKIAFASDRLTNNDFRPYVMNADGTGAAILTADPLASSTQRLDWKPDGTSILVETALDIYTIDPSAATTDDVPVNVTNSASNDRHPSWSPDGSTFVFSSDRAGGGNDEIYVANADGSSPTRMTTSDTLEQDPVYSPDGTTILFTNNSGIQTMAAAGGDFTDLDGGSTSQIFPDQQPLTTLTIAVDVVPDQGQDFHFSTTGNGLTPFDLDDDADGTLASSTTFSGITPGAFTVTADAVVGFVVTDIVCTADAETPDTTNRTVSITLTPGEQQSCTFVMTQTGTLTVVQDTVPNDPADFQYSTIRFGPSAVLDDDADPTLSNTATFEFAPGTIPLVQQTVIPGIPLTKIVCSEPAAINLAVRSAGVTLDAGDAVTCTFTNARAVPDAQISLAAPGPYAGNNVYNPRRDALQPQVKSKNIARGKMATYIVRIQNDRVAPDSFRVLGSGNTAVGTVRYFNGLVGTQEITSQVKLGTFKVTNVPAGTSKFIRIVVKIAPNAARLAKRDALVTITSLTDPTKKDTVRGRFTVV